MITEQCLNDAVDLRGYLKVIKKRKMMIVFVILFCLISTTIWTSIIPKTYEVYTLVRIGSIGELLLSKQEAIYYIKSQSKLKGAIKKFKLEMNSAELKNALYAEDISGTDFIGLRMRFESPDMALKLCNYIVNDFIREGQKIYDRDYEFAISKIKKTEERLNNIEEYRQKLNKGIGAKEFKADFPLIQNTLFSYESIATELNEKVFNLKSKLMNSKKFEIFEAALLPKYAIKPNKKLNVILAGVLGLMLGVFAAFFKEFLLEKQAE